jgi:MFS family permease
LSEAAAERGDEPRDDETAARPLTFAEQLRSFARPFWAANVMELVERLAYYGVRVVVPIYIASSEDPNGLHFTNAQKGTILSAWALTQTIVSMVVGGFADRYGTKRTIAASIGLKMLGYLGMAYLRTYAGFFAACQLLAFGTAVFKPGVQGTVALGTTKRNAAVGWGIFYEVVNIGGALGPPLAGALRVLAWKYVFLACAGIVSLNFLTLLTYAEPARSASKAGAGRVLVESFTKILRPRLLAFIAILCGFWAMFMQLFDALPNYIEEWTDSAGVVAALGLHEGQLARPTPRGLQVPQEWMINLDAAMIVLFVVVVSAWAARWKRLNAIAIGLLVSSIALLACSVQAGWACLGGVFLFSIGEMISQPPVFEYFAAVAPKGEEALYMGYNNVPVAVGWTLSDLAAGHLYEVQGDKANLAIRYLREHALLAPDALAKVERTGAMDALARATGLDARGCTQLLWDAYHPYVFWFTWAGIGVASAIAMLVFARSARQKGAPWYV